MHIDNPGCVLADMPQFGRVFDCGCCGNIHLMIGPVSLVLAPEDYIKVVTMIHASAARFETWLEETRRLLDCRKERLHANPDIDADPV